jgi:antitoxin component YwqK of YwqJK toxin-antitoxin module
MGKSYGAIILIILRISLSNLSAQENTIGKTLGSQVHTFAQVFDSNYGIEFYDKYNPVTDGDSVRKFVDGTLCNNMIDDYYPDGKLLHKGFYIKGKLTLYMNYYPDGQQERVFRPTSDRKNELLKYYPNKALKSDMDYYDGQEYLWQDYYDNGQLSYIEEYDKKHERLFRRCSYYKDGKPESIFEPIKSKDPIIRYSLKEYFSNGQLKEESEAIYDKDSYNFIKDGDDKQYDEKGNIVTEYDYVGGKINTTIK